MVIPVNQNVDLESYDDSEQFQKITSRREGRMPVGRTLASARASHRTAASRKASRAISWRASGKHHRRKHSFKHI